MTYVVDSSLALSWCFPDEYSTVARAAYRLAENGSLFVPDFWHIEAGNVLGLALKRKRIDVYLLNRALLILGQLDIESVEVHISRNVNLILHAMSTSGLTAYDVLYVELAKQLRLPLGTLDGQMARAAKSAGVTLVVEPQ